MTYSASLGSTISNTQMRTPEHLSVSSGMCAVCTMNCAGTCEIGLSAVRGSEAIYPFATDLNQFASEKKYPLDYSHLSINGRVFGSWGIEPNAQKAIYPMATHRWHFGKANPIALNAPIVLPAMAKLNWQDYFAGAALAGVVAVIGEDVVAKDPNLVLNEGLVSESPLLEAMVQAFKTYDRGVGDIVVQANTDDERLGVLEYALSKLGVESVEMKFGQAAKGIQGLGRLKSIDDALKMHHMGYSVHPDPSMPEHAEQYARGVLKTFEKIGQLPMWDEAHLTKRVSDLRALGAKRICFKTGPFDGEDLIRLLKIASVLEIDLVTFDGAGGGTGNSPAKMMNEWGIPTFELECLVFDIAKALAEKGYAVPQIAITGGIAMEDQVFKALALGQPYVDMIGIGRAAMAAAMSGKHIGDLVEAGNTPKAFERFGSSKASIFENYKVLEGLYGERMASMSTGAIGLYSYLERVMTGVQQLMALNRRFNLEAIRREDVVPLTTIAAEVTGLEMASSRVKKALEKIETQG